MNPVRGSGLAAATTTTSWSALATTAVYRPRSTVMIRPVTASSWLGRSLVRGRVPFLLGRIRTSDSSQESVLRATGGVLLCCGSLRQHGFPELREARHGLCRGSDVLNFDAGYGQAQDGTGGGHTVVG